MVLILSILPPVCNIALSPSYVYMHFNPRLQQKRLISPEPINTLLTFYLFGPPRVFGISFKTPQLLAKTFQTITDSSIAAFIS